MVTKEYCSESLSRLLRLLPGFGEYWQIFQGRRWSLDCVGIIKQTTESIEDLRFVAKTALKLGELSLFPDCLVYFQGVHSPLCLVSPVQWLQSKTGLFYKIVKSDSQTLVGSDEKKKIVQSNKSKVKSPDFIAIAGSRCMEKEQSRRMRGKAKSGCVEGGLALSCALAHSYMCNQFYSSF